MSSIASTSSIPVSLPVPCPESPWRVSSPTFNRLKQTPAKPYRKYELLPSDKEYEFVYQYFHAQKPTNRAIKRIFYHNSVQNTIFEAALTSMEKEANKPTFAPQWQNDKIYCKRRAEMIKRFETTAAPFSPFSINFNDNDRKETFRKVKILPL